MIHRFSVIIISCIFFQMSCYDGDPETSKVESYVTGDAISLEHQQMEFGYCYPPDSTGNTFSFAEYSGKVFMLEMSASWWPGCFTDIPEGELIYDHWKDDPRVKILHSLDDHLDGPSEMWNRIFVLWLWKKEKNKGERGTWRYLRSVQGQLYLEDQVAHLPEPSCGADRAVQRALLASFTSSS